jgi:hypothetical protein
MMKTDHPPNTPENGPGTSPEAPSFAERLELPLEPREAGELNQLAGRIHKDLRTLRDIPLGDFEPPVAFRPGGEATE